MRTIKEEKSAESSIDRYIEQWSRIDDVYEAIKWRLARKPETGTSIGNGFSLIASTEVFSAEGVPRLVVLYCFSDIEVIIIDVRVA